jgi:hypothetical protein
MAYGDLSIEYQGPQTLSPHRASIVLVVDRIEKKRGRSGREPAAATIPFVRRH